MYTQPSRPGAVTLLDREYADTLPEEVEELVQTILANGSLQMDPVADTGASVRLQPVCTLPRPPAYVSAPRHRKGIASLCIRTTPTGEADILSLYNEYMYKKWSGGREV